MPPRHAHHWASEPQQLIAWLARLVLTHPVAPLTTGGKVAAASPQRQRGLRRSWASRTRQANERNGGSKWPERWYERGTLSTPKPAEPHVSGRNRERGSP
jgi:hypothetical protein